VKVFLCAQSAFGLSKDEGVRWEMHPWPLQRT